MNQEIVQEIIHIAQDFESIAQKVNDSSIQRQKYAAQIDPEVDKANELGSEIIEELMNISLEDRILHNQNYLIFNTCERLNVNIRKQTALLERIKIVPEKIQGSLKQIAEYNQNLQKTIQSALEKLLQIIPVYNEIILLDNLIIERKNIQKDMLQNLKNSTFMIHEDIEHAIQGSEANLNRGRHFSIELQQIDEFFQSNNIEKIAGLIATAEQGQVKAQAVNEKSKSQLSFAQTVYEFAENLYSETKNIQGLVTEKKDMVHKELSSGASIAELISKQIQEYLQISPFLEDIIQQSEKFGDIERTTSIILRNLASYIQIAVRDIEEISNLKYDTNKTISQINELSEIIEELSEKEIQSYQNIRSLVEKMTEETKYPIDGSEKNMENARTLALLLSQLRDQLA